jgi:phosphoenolpyruvate synthase/pyruvate phosphate dikinase
MCCIIASSSDENLVGAKAAKLSLLASVTGINIPPYFVLATDAFNCIMGRYSDKIRLLKGLTAESLEIPVISQEIQDDIICGGLPENLANTISSAYHEFSRRLGAHDALVSVRSSATAEDGTKASFAGQYSTCLNVQGSAELLGAIRRVWASTYSTQVISYRIKNYCPPETTRMQ